jgi:hypothetical protein
MVSSSGRQSGLQANDPHTQWVLHDVVMRDWEEQREEILAMIKTKK